MEQHTHSHEHAHSHGSYSPDETLALLEYMAKHNEHHTEELHSLSHGVPEEAAALLHKAVELMSEGNEKIREALKIMKGE